MSPKIKHCEHPMTTGKILILLNIHNLTYQSPISGKPYAY